MNPWMFLCVWIGAQVLQLVFGIVAFRQARALQDKQLGPLIASWIASVSPLLTWIVFLRVFVVGGGSNVAQVAGEDSYALWRIWYGVWPLLSLGNFLGLTIVAITTLLPPYPPKCWPSWLSRACGIVGGGFALYVVAAFLPDA